MMQLGRLSRSVVSLLASRVSCRGLAVLADKQNGYGGSVGVNIDSDVAVITMNRGENRMNDEFLDQMNDALDQVLSEPTVKAVITTGDGKFFCNGLDLQWLAEVSSQSENHIPVFVKRWCEFNLRILTFPIPTVAAVNGHAYAGGAIFSLCYDYRVMRSDRGWWCMNEVELGLRFPSWVIALARTKLAGKGARTMLDANCFGRRFPAAEAKDAGIVHEICPTSELLTTCKSVVDALMPQGALDRSFVQHTKTQLFDDIIVASTQGAEFKLN